MSDQIDELLLSIKEMSPETLSNCRACFDVQSLYWKREEATDPERLAEIDRQLVDYLFKLDETFTFEGQKINLLDQLEFTPLEIARLRQRREISKMMRIKLRIFCSKFTYSLVGA